MVSHQKFTTSTFLSTPWPYPLARAAWQDLGDMSKAEAQDTFVKTIEEVSARLFTLAPDISDEHQRLLSIAIGGSHRHLQSLHLG